MTGKAQLFVNDVHKQALEKRGIGGRFEHA